MAEIDTSIYKVAPTDPMTTVGNALSIANTAQQNRLGQIQLQRGQMDLDAQRGVGDAYRQSIDENGNFDAPGFARRAAQGPASVLGPANTTGAAAAAAAATGAKKVAAGLSRESQAWASSNILPLFNDPAKQPSITDVTGVISDGISSGAIDTDTGKELLLQAVRNGTDPNKIRGWAQRSFIGQNLGSTQTEAGTSTTEPGVGTTVQSKGQSVVAGQGGSPKPKVAPLPIRKVPAAPKPEEAAPAPGVRTSPPESVTETYKKASLAHAADLDAATTTLGNARNLEAAYEKMQTLTPSDATGIGAAKNAAYSAVSSLFGLDPPTSTLSRAEAEKYLERSKANIPAAQRSDMAQQLANVSNPSFATPLDATKALTRSAIGFGRMDAAMPMAWDAAHPEAATGNIHPDYLKHRADFMNAQDPDGFVFATLPPDEQRALIAEKKKAGPAAYKRFSNSVGVYEQTLGKGQQ